MLYLLSYSVYSPGVSIMAGGFLSLADKEERREDQRFVMIPRFKVPNSRSQEFVDFP